MDNGVFFFLPSYWSALYMFWELARRSGYEGYTRFVDAMAMAGSQEFLYLVVIIADLTDITLFLFRTVAYTRLLSFGVQYSTCRVTVSSTEIETAGPSPFFIGPRFLRQQDQSNVSEEPRYPYAFIVLPHPPPLLQIIDDTQFNLIARSNFMCPPQHYHLHTNPQYSCSFTIIKSKLLQLTFQGTKVHVIISFLGSPSETYHFEATH
ncbi:hypothetical protein EYC80_004194 [Monilinia laxa]|uniref:Uncharacterized protein n=1 Tax=Monilinia laxa TaxID=61186 RepID=A0A5N6KLZ8_MONLA|nr:hypothetical protein EYC80_004194 [Monilinia laxa]